MRCFNAFLKKELKAMTLYRMDFLLKLCYGLIAMYGVRCLWYALYAQDPQIAGRDLPSMITYAMLAVALDMVFYPSATDSAPHLYIAQQVRTGSIDTNLLRPMNFRRQLFMHNSSSVLFALAGLVLPGWLIAVIFFGMQLPASPLYALSFFISCIFSHCILFALNFLLGMVSFVTTDIRNIVMTYGGLISILSGKLVPIWLFPAWAQGLCYALPFRCIFETPLNIYTGAYTPAEVLWNIFFQLSWTAVLFLLGSFTWNKVHKNLTVQGG